MRSTDNIIEIRSFVKEAKRNGKSIGFVPTMGFLHKGHISLMNAAKNETDIVIVSIFVNPTQFGPNEDFSSYPRDFERDAALCEEAGVDLIFYPTPEIMYPENYFTYVNVEKLTDSLCGASRPGHFRGVTTVVAKLFNIVMPDRAFFGQKDAQQVAVIDRMTKDLNFDIEIVACPIIREDDGLAMSSRNVYLNPEERKAALILSKSLEYARLNYSEGDISGPALTKKMIEFIKSEPLARIDYVSIVDYDSLQPIEFLNKNFLVVLAVYIGKTRLIDNLKIKI